MHKNDASTSVAASRAPGSGHEDVSQTARAFVCIRELLLRGEFPRGERIAELPLGARLGMSRTPVHVALEQLTHVGLLDVGAAGGFVVREFTVADVRDAIELRGVLEGTAARLAAERLDSNDELDELRRHRDEVGSLTDLSISVDSTNSFERYMRSNEAFHAAIVTLAKSEMLARVMEHANSLPFAAPSAMVFPTSMQAEAGQTLAGAQQQHDAIVEAIQKRQGTRAEHLAREHARLALRVFERALSDENVLRNVPGQPLINVLAS